MAGMRAIAIFSYAPDARSNGARPTFHKRARITLDDQASNEFYRENLLLIDV